jgi:hypothetical protein
VKAVGMFAQGISAFDSGKYTRDAMKVNAQNVENAGVSERDRVRYQARLQMGQQLVDQGGSGFSTGTGTALDALHASAINRELDLAMSRANADGKAGDFRIKGRMAYAQGKAALAGGIISGAAEIASEVAGAFGGAGAAGGEGAMASPGLGNAEFTPGFLSSSPSTLSYSGPSLPNWTF